MSQEHEISQRRIDEEIDRLEEEIQERRAEIVALRKHSSRKVENFSLKGPGGSDVTLSDLFGTKTDLILIHNMGSRCPMCTLWADGFNGVYPHLADRAAFAVVSPDTVERQREFALGRGWNFPMYSDEERRFTFDMNFAVEKDGKTYFHPGLSTFRKLPDGTIERVAFDHFGPGDPYGLVYPAFDLLADGVGEWFPSFTYETSEAAQSSVQDR
jgi:predicted dithiol-disulfide oxidoreductase (DUF899 family)